MTKITELLAYSIIAAFLVITCLVVKDRDIENTDIQELIRIEVKAEMDRRYRNVPHISVEKVYTLHATGEDIVLETPDPSPKPPQKKGS